MRRIIAAVLTAAFLATLAGGVPAYAQNTAADNQIATGYLKNVRYVSNGSGEAVYITAIKYKDYSAFELSGPQRIVIDIYNAQSTGKQQLVSAGGKIIRQIRYAQFDTYTARIVLEVNDQAEYGIEKTSSGLVFYIGEEPAGINQEESQEQVKEGQEKTIQPTTSSAVRQIATIHKLFKIRYTPGETSEEVAFLLNRYSGYSVARLTDPDRLVVNIPKPGYSGSARQLNVNGPQIRAIGYEKTARNGARITLSLNTQSRYTLDEEKGQLLLKVQEPTYKNICYHNNGDRVYFTLTDAVLTEGNETLKELYTGTYDDTGMKYTITFPTGKADLGNGTMDINDSFLKSMKVQTDADNGTTSLTFTGTGTYRYLAYTRNNPGITAITLLKPALEKQKLVVIDAGHGGPMTGAIYKSLNEKDLNLDIAIRLNKLLKQKGVSTYMIRGDDSDIDIFERAYIANRLNAKLYLSIHNNAMDDKNYSGSMTLYCPAQGGSGFNGANFADLIQNSLVSRLKTVDRMVKERPDLIVLKMTNMPAALAEIAFMTNAKDRTNLQRAVFRQTAAQALYDAVVKALKKV